MTQLVHPHPQTRRHAGPFSVLSFIIHLDEVVRASPEQESGLEPEDTGGYDPEHIWLHDEL